MSFVHNLTGAPSIKDAYALISVAYPEGSTCTCTLGTKVLTATDTSGSYVFLIPEAGTWTVRAYDGSTYESSDNKDSHIISIVNQYQIENIFLAYSLYIYNRGEPTGYTWSAAGDARAYVVYNNYFGLFGQHRVNAGAAVNVDVTGYSILGIKYSIEKTTSGVGFQGCNIGSVSFTPTITLLHTESEFEVDISSLTGSQVLNLKMGAHVDCQAFVYEVYLTR